MNSDNHSRFSNRLAYMLFAGVLGLMPMTSHAVLLFDNGNFTTGTSYFADVDRGSTAYTQPADDFVLGAGSEITGIEWWGEYTGANTPTEPDDFTAYIFADSSGLPANSTPLFTINMGDTATRSVAYDFGPNRTLYSFSAMIDPLVLAGSTTFWLSIMNDTIADTDDTYIWSRSQPLLGNTMAVRGVGTIDESWATAASSTGLAFKLYGNEVSVPEPPTLLLVILALAVGGAILRRNDDKTVPTLH